MHCKGQRKGNHVEIGEVDVSSSRGKEVGVKMKMKMKKKKKQKPWILRFFLKFMSDPFHCMLWGMPMLNIDIIMYHDTNFPNFNINVQCCSFPHVPPNYVYLVAFHSHFYIHNTHLLFPTFSLSFTQQLISTFSSFTL